MNTKNGIYFKKTKTAVEFVNLWIFPTMMNVHLLFLRLQALVDDKKVLHASKRLRRSEVKQNKYVVSKKEFVVTDSQRSSCLQLPHPDEAVKCFLPALCEVCLH